MSHAVIPEHLLAAEWRLVEFGTPSGRCDLCGTPLKHPMLLEADGRPYTVGYECAAHVLGKYARGIASKVGSWTRWKVSRKGNHYKRIKGAVVTLFATHRGFGLSIRHDGRKATLPHLADTLDAAKELAPAVFHIWRHERARAEAALEALWDAPVGAVG